MNSTYKLGYNDNKNVEQTNFKLDNKQNDQNKFKLKLNLN